VSPETKKPEKGPALNSAEDSRSFGRLKSYEQIARKRFVERAKRAKQYENLTDDD
jgi:hypothetical protein